MSLRAIILLAAVVAASAAAGHQPGVDTGNGELELAVKDNGKGFDVASALERASGGQHLGLLGVLERVRSLGGEVDIDSAPGQGAELRVRIPIS